MKQKLFKFIENPKYIFWIYLLVAILTATSKFRGGPEKYNNYLIFKGVFINTLHQRNIYETYPDLFADSNHYGILFSILIAPFTFFPDWLGMILWNLANVSLFIFAIKCLPFSDKLKSFFAWLCLQELITALVSFQFNIALTGLIILSAVYLYKQKETQSAFAILLGTFVKIYGVVGLSQFFFIKNKGKFIVSLLIISIVFLILPMFLSSIHFGLQSYLDWMKSLQEKNLTNQVLGNYQDISLMGFVRRVLQNPDISNLYFLVAGLPIFFLPYLRLKQYKNLAFRLMILASSLIFLVIFSTGSESPTYIIAVSGVMIWFLMKKEKSVFDIGLLVFVMILTCFSPSDLFPKFIRENYVIKYSLKSLPCALVWFKITYELLTKNFEKDYQFV